MNKYYLVFGWSQTSKWYQDKGTTIKDYFILFYADTIDIVEEYAKNEFDNVYSRIFEEKHFRPEYFPLGLLDTITL